VEERCKELEAEKQDRILKSFELKIEVNPEYHPKIIVKKGAVISKIWSDHGVQIKFAKKGDPDKHIITITGYEHNTQAARDDIMKIVNELNYTVEVKVRIDTRVHWMLIGTQGCNIRKIMEYFSVNIKFPRSIDQNRDMVTVIGAEENVLGAIEHLFNLEEEYMQDVDDAELMEIYHSISSCGEDDGSSLGHGGRVSGFVVTGGPWERHAPDTASTSEFPSFAGGGEASQSVPSPSRAWGPRR
jgi:predicted PilT family ATPase